MGQERLTLPSTGDSPAQPAQKAREQPCLSDSVDGSVCEDGQTDPGQCCEAGHPRDTTQGWVHLKPSWLSLNIVMRTTTKTPAAHRC